MGQTTALLIGSCESHCNRIGTLCSSTESLTSWSNDEGWIDIRGGEADATMAEYGCSSSDITFDVGGVTVSRGQADILVGDAGGRKSSGLVSGCNLPCLGRDTRHSIQEHQFFL
ncbi:hypothetical protein MLD38_025798 [Melastoma candidum]|uniref:Uncharacterized protein n=1 Tax=Melastoma candidum TaxID=119954 RepID=A0ACB9NWK7_9MYRT|nr:hypothetical protein MLD38_025798 [Melastoma candidum]